MKRRLLIALVLLAYTSAIGQTPNSSSLDTRVRGEVASFKGKVSLYARNLDTNENYSFNGDERVRTASTIKVAVMIEAFSRVAEGRAKWSDRVGVDESSQIFRFGSVAGALRWTASHVARLRKSDDGGQ